MAKTMNSGHKMVWVKGKGYVYEHRLNLEKKLGRRLKKGEHVHHKDGNPANNKASNLEAVSMSEHNKVDPEHHKGGRPKGS